MKNDNSPTQKRSLHQWWKSQSSPYSPYLKISTSTLAAVRCKETTMLKFMRIPDCLKEEEKNGKIPINANISVAESLYKRKSLGAFRRVYDLGIDSSDEVKP